MLLVEKARLEQWSLVETPYKEGLRISLSGRVYDHSSFEDGDQVYTTRIQSISLDGLTATTKNTEYTLGERLKVNEVRCNGRIL